MDEDFDPFQIFQVTPPQCIILTTRVMRGRKITKGRVWDFMDCPDPYIQLRVRDSPEGTKWTKCLTNESNPIWCEEFEFILNPNEKNVMTITLMEGNYGPDSEIWNLEFDLTTLPYDELVKKTFAFSWHGEVDMEFYQRLDSTSDLRFSLCLSDEEKQFRDLRLKRVFECMQTVLGNRAPKTLEEVPVIAVIGSGGGFRAMTAFTGAMKALEDTRLLECVSYIAALSGSSWALSSLYSHPNWPDQNIGSIQEEIKEAVSHSPLRLLAPQILIRYLERVLEKRNQGQPVSFTDFFGMMVGETLLGQCPQAKLSDQQVKVKGGRSPMPLYAGVHVKKDVSARVFQEWLEFSPFEIGLPKYGCFQPARLFGAKYFLGHLVKRYDEPPLHYLQGLWGSAFCILFKQLVKKDVGFDRKLDPEEIQRNQIIKENNAETDSKRRKPPVTYNRLKSRRSLENILKDCESLTKSMSIPSQKVEEEPKPSSAPSLHKTLKKTCAHHKFDRKRAFENVASSSKQGAGKMVDDDDDDDSLGDDDDSTDSSDSETGELELEVTDNPKKKITKKSTSKKATSSFWENAIEKILAGNNILNSRSGRAAVIHNFMRGLEFTTPFPISPFPSTSNKFQFDGVKEQTVIDEVDEFVEVFQPGPQLHQKHMYLVDAGLTFNSPYPLVLRQQRGVDLILSFDFSARCCDDYPPFKEVLLAYKWSLIHHVPFPEVNLDEFHRDGLKEMYIFQDKANPQSPIIMHFVLVNNAFRDYKSPGVPRETEEEKEFGNFSVFDDPQTPFSTFNFTYHPMDFERLTTLSEFNTLLCEPLIKDCIVECIEKRRNKLNKAHINLDDIQAAESSGLVREGTLQKLEQIITDKDVAYQKLHHSFTFNRSQSQEAHQLASTQEENEIDSDGLASLPDSPTNEKSSSLLDFVG